MKNTTSKGIVFFNPIPDYVDSSRTFPDTHDEKATGESQKPTIQDFSGDFTKKDKQAVSQLHYEQLMDRLNEKEKQ